MKYSSGGVGKVGEESMWAPQEAGQHIPLQREIPASNKNTPQLKYSHSDNRVLCWPQLIIQYYALFSFVKNVAKFMSWN